MRLTWFLLSGVCHQIPERSLHLQGIALPLCARCAGMFPGILLGMATLWATRQGRRTGLPRGLALRTAVLLMAAWVVDGLNSFVALLREAPLWWQTTNAIRLVTGTGCGLGIAMLLYPIYHFAVSEAGDSRPVLAEPWRLAAILGVGAAWVALMLSWKTAPYALVSWALALAVLASLGLVNGLLANMLLRRAQESGRRRPTWLPWALGVCAAMAEMTVMAVAGLWIA